MLRRLENDDLEEFIGLLYYIIRAGTDGIDSDTLNRYKQVIKELGIRDYQKLYQKSFYLQQSVKVKINQELREAIEEFDESLRIDKYEEESNKLSEILNRNCLVYKGEKDGVYIDSNTSSIVIVIK